MRIQDHPTVPSDLGECLGELRETLRRQVRIGEGLIAALLKAEPSEEAEDDVRAFLELRRPLILLLQAAGASSESLLLVTAEIRPGARDGYVIARGIVETLINACYFLAVGREAVEQAWAHAEEMMRDDLNRESRTARSLIRLTFGESQPARPIHETVKGSRPRRKPKSWTRLSVDQRISHAGAVLGEAVERDLHIARFMVYRHGSEIVHGSLFGAMFWLGLTNPRPLESADALARHVGEHEMLVLFAAILAWEGTFQALRHHGITSPSTVSESFFRRIGRLKYFTAHAT